MTRGLLPFVCEKPCPCCGESLHWSQNEHPPAVEFDHLTGKVWSVSLMRFCISCGYKEIGRVNVNKDPIWQEVKE